MDDHKAAKQIAAVCLIATMLACGSVLYYNQKNAGYAVKYQGKFLGYVRDTNSAVMALNQIEENIQKCDPSIDINNELEFEKVVVAPDKISEGTDLVKDIESELYIKYTCYALFLNGSEFAVLSSEEEANSIIEGVKKYFEEEEAKTGGEVLNVSIKDELKVEKRVANNKNATDAKTVMETLLAGKGVTKKYEVKSGDSVWRIARDNNMSIQDIAAVNPGLNIEKLQIGQLVNLSVSEPYLNVEATVKTTYDENIKFDTKYVSDSNLYKGDSKILERGQYGINRIVKQVTKLNGQEVESTVLSTEKIKDPVTQVLARGTKQLVGSGKFQWPTNGSITSKFASRGGSHKGLDIAAPRGTHIYAADAGTVIHSGWYYGYGYLVKIDHGNGYETYYGHCSALHVKAGQTVKRGQHIANVGSTGNSTGNHVHFEVRLNGTAKNPLNYLN